MSQPADAPVLYFDGICNLCSNIVKFIIKHERSKKILFASLQSEAGKAAVAHLQKDKGIKADSFILFYKGNYYIKSSAALICAKLIGGPWQLLYTGMMLPRIVRDGIYDLVARNRYKWFGKNEQCMVPGPEVKARFLSQ